jgi:DNA-binding response OmpR family regulator
MSGSQTHSPDARRRVLLVVEDAALAELLAEALCDAGHTAALADHFDTLPSAMGQGAFEVAIVDLDTRGRRGKALIQDIRRAAPATTVIALLPCGGLEVGGEAVAFDVGVEKPARLGAILAAVDGPA